MMGRFVHEKSATIVFISMPSSEIICPVLRVQQPFKVDRENIADYVFSAVPLSSCDMAHNDN